EFLPIIKERLDISQNDLSETSYEIINQISSADFKKEIQKQPYIFNDPHMLQKKIDVKKLQYGSKIDKDSPSTRNDLFTVKEIISAEKLRLNNDLIIKLIGVKEKLEINGKATDFLSTKTKGKKVFLKFDHNKYDKENNLLCYLYLENKTFVNAHLIKNGLVDVDGTIDFKYKEKFIKLYNETNA
ncbi:MAG: thermonuclease family protein, partial [Ignavibacteria bacterium]|nr:thermonuclease family protein [Ignavibacteria bacterium]